MELLKSFSSSLPPFIKTTQKKTAEYRMGTSTVQTTTIVFSLLLQALIPQTSADAVLIYLYMILPLFINFSQEKSLQPFEKIINILWSNSGVKIAAFTKTLTMPPLTGEP
jgi:hypothetical protein